MSALIECQPRPRTVTAEDSPTEDSPSKNAWNEDASTVNVSSEGVLARAGTHQTMKHGFEYIRRERSQCAAPDEAGGHLRTLREGLKLPSAMSGVDAAGRSGVAEDAPGEG